MKRYALMMLGALLALGGCGTARNATAPVPPPAAAPPTADPSADVNATDIMFVQMMLPHHRQGLQIVRLVRDRSARQDVKILAAAIDSTQSAELDTMSGWLRGWNQPQTAADPHVHDAHGGIPETSLAEIAALQQATGADFERRFLDTMIAHQDDAVQMARMELASGANRQAKEFAKRVEQSRSAQIQQMLKWRNSG
jgi:uncharacterized protein (DUF305 family)